ncbi:MAG: hypothetical protein PHU25_18175 [Deltaproteobacteria bacterium]|nr:hypothetical protein [Deltaproteobacteria bacterium]
MLGRKINKITVLLDDDEFGRFDSYCESQGFKKSTLIVKLIRDHLAAAQYQEQLYPPSRGHDSAGIRQTSSLAGPVSRSTAVDDHANRVIR